MKLTLPDGSIKKYDEPKSLYEIAEDISISLKKSSLAAKVNDSVFDMGRTIDKDAEIAFITEKDPLALDILRHSTAHLLAEAVKKLYPHAKFGVGPVIEEGFYYDIDLGDDVLVEEDLKTIEKEMKKIASQNAKIERSVLTYEKALEFFKDDPYKVELIKDLPND
jgi:threonyl-tRNA synthetase